MLWLGGFLALDLTTSTPDALCPPLEEARAAVNARVGEVRGDYHAEFALIRADDGRQTLSFVLKESDTEVLRRELPLDAAGCQDAAQTIALVLERYFDAIELPAAQPREPEPKGVAGSPAAPPPRDAPAARAPSLRSSELQVRAGLLYELKLGTAAVLGASYYPSSWRLSSNWRWGVGLEVAPFLARQSEIVRQERVEAFMLQGALWVPFNWTHSRWSVSGGPWAQLRLQRAEAPSLERHRAAYRTLAGLGGVIQVGLELAPSWALLAGVAAGPQLHRAAIRYVLDGGAAGQKEVLVPDAWFGHGQLTLELRL
jgi:hypothetical protein